MADTPNDQPTSDLPLAEGEMTARFARMLREQDDISIEQPGDEVGPYKLLSMIGEGGFGSVWIAERREPFVQRVALKLIKAGMDSKAVIARFEQERQAMAVMNHPNIAKVLDGGLTKQGRPYFAMEYVKGEPITEFCDARRLGIKERLELFTQACDAIQHAHVKGIVHRDIKPSNILAFELEGEGLRLKVIDFGVAKAMHHTLTDKTIFTETGQMIGTPAYMSPEQADPSTSDIDTRSDVYSLGVLLYELMAGATPFDARELRAKAYGEVQRTIREEDPPSPSARLSTISTRDAELASRIERSRGLAIRELAQQLRRELEWIPLKAMRKERQSRYQSAMALAEDIHNYLDGRPLVAAPESSGYRLRKYVRRNRALVTGAGAVIAALLAGMVATGIALARAQKAEADARTQLAATVRAETRERERADQLARVGDFHAQMLGDIDLRHASDALVQDIVSRFEERLSKAGTPEADLASRRDALLRELRHVNAVDVVASLMDQLLLRPAVESSNVQFDSDPITHAKLNMALAHAYRRLGQDQAALPLIRFALTTYRRALSADDQLVLTAITDLGTCLVSQGEFAAAEAMYAEALGEFRRTLGETHPATLITLDLMSTVLLEQGKHSAAELMTRKALTGLREVLGERDPHTLTALSKLGSILYQQHRFAEAEDQYREALRLSQAAFGDEYEVTLAVLAQLGLVLVSKGELDAAEPLIRDALRGKRKVLGDDHPETIFSIRYMSLLLEARGALSEAEAYEAEVLERRRRVRGDDHPETIDSIRRLGDLLSLQRVFDRATPLLREACERSSRAMGEESIATLRATVSLAALLQATGRPSEAEPLLRASLERFSRVLGEENVETLYAKDRLCEVLEAQGRFPEAEAMRRESLEVSRRAFGDQSTVTIGRMTALAELLMRRRRLAEAEPLLRACVAQAHQMFGEETPEAIYALARLGYLLQAQCRYQDAESTFLQVIDRGSRVFGGAEPWVKSVKEELIETYQSWERAEPGKGYGAKADTLRAEKSPAATEDPAPQSELPSPSIRP
jgi:eukaryotic-like serine/threonine-protein kinase